jgi:hypothetical protein
VHGEFAVGRAGPFGLGPVAVEFDAVFIRVAQVEGLTYPMVGGAIKWDFGDL